MKISTIAVHGGLADTSHYAAAFPVYLTSTFIQKGPTEFREYGYSRTANPTRSDVEKHAADIEGAKHGIATATGMAAVSLVFDNAQCRRPRADLQQRLRRHLALCDRAL